MKVLVETVTSGLVFAGEQRRGATSHLTTPRRSLGVFQR